MGLSDSVSICLGKYAAFGREVVNSKYGLRICVVALIVLLALVGFFVMGGSNTTQCKYAIDYLPYEDKETEACGLLGADAKPYTSSLFKETPTPVINGFYAIDGDEGYDLYTVKDGKHVAVEGTSGLCAVGVMSDGLMPVCRGYEHITVIDDKGNHVYTLDEINGIEVKRCYSYSCERMRVQLSNDTYVYVDKQGNQLFGQSYEWCTDFVGDVAVVNIEDDTYALIDKQGASLFTFDSDDEDKIVFSPQYQRLATVDEDERVIIYDFQGRQVGIYPSKVQGVYALGKDNFVFKNGYSYGLMAYTGEELLRAKYDQLVPNGKYFLALTDDDDEIKLIDYRGNTLKKLDGEKVYDFRQLGYDFPCVVKRVDGEIYLVDGSGDMIDRGLFNFEIEEYDLEEACEVRSDYFPQDEVLQAIMDMCGHGSGLPIGQNAFFVRNERHCHPYEVNFINNSRASQFNGKDRASMTVASGVNYNVQFEVVFDEPIAQCDTINQRAWLTSMIITVACDDVLQGLSFFDVCMDKLQELDCKIVYSYNSDHIFLSNNEDNLIVMRHGSLFGPFDIRICQNNEYNYTKWVEALKKK